MNKKLLLIVNPCSGRAKMRTELLKVVEILSADDYAMSTNAICNIEDIERSIKIIMNSDADYEFVSTIVPMHIKEADMESICASVKGAKCFRINQFVPGGCFDRQHLF